MKEDKINTLENLEIADNKSLSVVEAEVSKPTNIIYNEPCEETMKRLPDKSVSLIIADPPYYKIKGEFDWKWKTFDEYLDWMEGLAKEFKRILADNGSLFVYGHAKRIAYIQVIYDKYFHLGNNIAWRKIECQTRRTDFEQARYFAPVTERILFYDNEREDYGTRDFLKVAAENISPFARIMKNRMQQLNISGSELAELQLSKNGNKTGWISNKLSGSEIPTKEQWALISEKLFIKEDYEKLRQQRELELQEWRDTQRYFNNFLKLEDVMDFSQEGQNSGQFDHDTIKPLKLSKAIVSTCSRETDLIYIPFVGSGTECVAVNELNRKFIGSEINKKYVEIAEARIKGSRNNYDMFYDKAY